MGFVAALLENNPLIKADSLIILNVFKLGKITLPPALN